MKSGETIVVIGFCEYCGKIIETKKEPFRRRVITVKGLADAFQRTPHYICKDCFERFELPR